MPTDPVPVKPKEQKAVNKTVYVCATDTCGVCLYIATEAHGLACPSCKIEGGLAIDGGTRNNGKWFAPPIVDGDN